MIVVLLQIQVAELVTLFPLCIAVKVTLAPIPPLFDKLIELLATIQAEEGRMMLGPPDFCNLLPSGFTAYRISLA